MCRRGSEAAEPRESVIMNRSTEQNEEPAMKRKIMLPAAIAAILLAAAQASAFQMYPDGSYGPDGPMTMAPDGTYHSGQGSQMYPDGSYGPQGSIHMHPDGTYGTGSGSYIRPDGSYGSTPGFEMTPDGKYVDRP